MLEWYFYSPRKKRINSFVEKEYMVLKIGEQIERKDEGSGIKNIYTKT